MRYLRSVLASMDTRDVADLLTVSLHGTETRDHGHAALLLACCVALADERCTELRSAVAEAARERGQFPTAAMLTLAPSPRHDEVRPPLDLGLGRPLTLGERKSLARRRDRDLMARALRDPDPNVIRVLLTNPTLTEDDVTRLCSRRPVDGQVLREVFRNTRWIVRYRVRRTLVLNPYTPVDLAMQLAPHLDAADARMALEEQSTPGPVRDICRRVAGLSTLH